MRIVNLAVVALFGMGLIACSDDATKESAAAEADEQTRESIADPLIDSLEKAKAVEQVVLDSKDNIDAALEESEGEKKTDD